MANEIYANQPSTTVSSGGTDAPASGTQEMWTVASSSSFPAASSGGSPPTQFHVADTAAGYTAELIAVTNVSGTTWTVTRGAESTTPVEHVAGFTITAIVTAGALGALAVNPMTALGDLIYGGTSGTPSQLAGNTTATKNFLVQTGSGSASAAPAWGTIAAADMPAGTTSAQGALQLDGTAGNIAALGTQAAGSTGKAADAGHVHPVTGTGRPATLIVAASGASAAWKATADYVCTGTSDQTQINEALAALPSSGGTVLLSDGTFTISGPVIPAINASVLRGQGTNATIIKTAAGSNCNGYQYSQSSQAYNLIFCSIQSLTFYGNYNAGAGDTEGYGCYINYSIGGGSLYTFWDFYCRDVWFENWPQDGFYATGGHGYVLDHCLGEYNGGSGCNFAATTDETDTPPRIINGTYKLNGADGIICNVDGGYVGANEVSNNTGDGVSLGGLSAVAVGNIIKLNTGTGVILTNTGARAMGNYITNNHAYGIHITGGHEGGSAAGNTVAYNGLHGVLSDNVRSVISSNYLLSNSYSGNGGTTGAADEINVTTGDYNGLENLIVGNMINCASSSRYGINFAAAGDTQGVAMANTILGAATASVNSAAPDTVFTQTTPYQASTLPRVVTNAYSLGANDNVVLLETANKALTLPTAAGVAGKQYTMKLTASGSGTVITSGTQTIDGAATYSLAAQYAYVTVMSDGTNWQVIGAGAQ